MPRRVVYMLSMYSGVFCFSLFFFEVCFQLFSRIISITNLLCSSYSAAYMYKMLVEEKLSCQGPQQRYTTLKGNAST